MHLSHTIVRRLSTIYIFHFDVNIHPRVYLHMCKLTLTYMQLCSHAQKYIRVQICHIYKIYTPCANQRMWTGLTNVEIFGEIHRGVDPGPSTNDGPLFWQTASSECLISHLLHRMYITWSPISKIMVMLKIILRALVTMDLVLPQLYGKESHSPFELILCVHDL